MNLRRIFTHASLWNKRFLLAASMIYAVPAMAQNADTTNVVATPIPGVARTTCMI